MKNTADAMRLVYLHRAINRSLIEPFSLLVGVLDLQSSLDVFYWRSNRANCRSSHNTRNGMPDSWQLLARVWWREAKNVEGRAWYTIGIEDGLVEDSPIEGQGAQHY